MSANDRYNSLFQYYAPMYGLTWRLVRKQAKAESSFNPNAKSPVGAQGLMQFMPATWAEWRARLKLPTEASPFNPEYAIWAGCAYMANLLKAMSGDYRLALACYNWGIGNVRRSLRTGERWPLETSNYVNRILGDGNETSATRRSSAVVISDNSNGD